MVILLATGIYPPEIGGPATFVPVLARFLVDQGHVVTVITYGDERTEQGSGWKVLPIRRGSSVLLRYLRYGWQVYKNATRADLVFLQGAVSEGLPGTLGAFFAGKPTVLRVPGDYAWEQYQQRVSLSNRERLEVFVTRAHRGSIRLLELIERWVAKRARRILVPSLYLKKIVGQWGIQSAQIDVVYNDVRPLPPPRLSRSEIRKQFGIASDARVLFSIARAVPWKGIEFLISLLKDLPSTHVLVVAGDGPLLEKWKTQIREQGLTNRVIFVGRWPHQELSDWFRAVDAFVLASGYEGFPHVAVEAAMQGLHGFLSDAGGNPETQHTMPGRTTILPYEDREAWLKALSAPVFPQHEDFQPSPQMGNQVTAILRSISS